MGGNGRPKARKDAKRRLREMTNNTGIDLASTQLKELSSSNSDISKIFKDVVTTTKEDKAHKMMMREQKPRFHEDRIMMTDPSTMILNKSLILSKGEQKSWKGDQGIHHQLNKMSPLPLII